MVPIRVLLSLRLLIQSRLVPLTPLIKGSEKVAHQQHFHNERWIFWSHSKEVDLQHGSTQDPDEVKSQDHTLATCMGDNRGAVN